ncbi:5-dehydro-4-deoxy-D-glucuronate isomerase [Roseicitreum antarcticum]|uniref:4-deoxy-L-threo-5-hexosulose-uronate ketol-isomerase n=1 Tax=Roseicitreum antarcticum TaxID=564137 RepID=A0A1H3CYZ2_9RHOB|nr:5-dehydro-4-deoxy-D-glucuronate isomerase [Roseicitreum antarcticum]SDX59361.1 4-deoxy-L-threo-5-hexosulose-uronate ketol-isomerase [Roseicitreum antarcticum]
MTPPPISWTTRYGGAPAAIDRMTGQELRAEYMVEGLFVPGTARMAYSHIDRMVLGGIVPTQAPIDLGDGAPVGTDHFFDAREAGIANLGHYGGKITVDGTTHHLAPRDVLYVGRGVKALSLESDDAANPACYYINSVPAGADHPTRLIPQAESKPLTFGSAERANMRTLRMYIHPEVAPSCLLLMGITDPAPGNVWNTMPPHLHERRMEAYLYFDMDAEDRVMHFMGRPDNTRHLVVGSGDAVLSPAWSIHMGAGTGPYAFVWGMTGENQVYQDVTPVAVKDLK